MSTTLGQLFGEGGLLAQRLPGYERREQQVEMASLVFESIQAQGRALIEAGTGTGKTLAYLVPAVLSGKKTLISTATKNLQEQIFYKDVPFLKALDLDVSAAYLKGRSNYLCKLRFDEFLRAPLFRSRTDATYFSEIVAWAKETTTGDRAELEDLPDDYPTWQELSTSTDSCLGSSCRLFDECYVTRNRREAAQAQIVIVNHHLFFADLSLKAGGHGEVLPNSEVVVFDEAHHLEETATSFFGRSVSLFRFGDLRGDLDRALRSLTSGKKSVLGGVLELADRAGTELSSLFDAVKSMIGPGDPRALPVEVSEDAAVLALLTQLCRTLAALRGAIGTAELGEATQNLTRRCGALEEDIRFCITRPESGWVYFAEFRGRRRDALFLKAAPIDLTAVFKRVLYPEYRTTTFTSATLAVDEAFHYFRSRMGLGVDEPVAEARLTSAFDYMRQAILYVPRDLSPPSAPSFVDDAIPTILSLLEITGGRAFVLFTSYRNMRRCHELIADQVEHNLLVQGERSRSALLNAFRREPSVLLATSSFWEGVDVPGDNLSLVIMDKLPFASPSDPVIQARIEYIKEQGGDPFTHYQLPQAAISLKQGFGRLIRHREDRGIVAVLDRRLVERSYGEVFLNTLPRTRRTRDLDVVRKWWCWRAEQRDEPVS